MRFKPVFILIWLLAVVAWQGCTEDKKEATPPPPPEVLVAEVIQKDVPVYRKWVATTDGMVNASILAKVQGYYDACMRGDVR